MANEKFAGLGGTTSDFLQLLLAVKNSTMRDTHVASLGEITQIDSVNEIYSCRLIPTLQNENEKSIQCYCVDGLTLTEGDWVLVLFLDRNFIQNLKQVRSGQNISKIQSQSELHSHTYGIIINKVKKSLAESQ